VPIVLKSGSLNLLETYGPVKAYNWTALPLPMHTTRLSYFALLHLNSHQSAHA
jgi:hypothetical protein